MSRKCTGLFLLCLISFFACSREDPDLDKALESLTVGDLVDDVKVLSSDAFEGRGPSSKGEEQTIAFLQREFQKLGLQPGNGDSFFQEVPLVAITADPNATLSITGKGRTTILAYSDDFMAWTKRVVGSASLSNSELVFVGYGIVAPEYEWNDYEGLDTKGKTVVILVNDPGFATQDSAQFNGNAMTYYGRWTYKYEEAARQGADGAIIVHETDPAGYPWEVVTGSWTGVQFDLLSQDNNMSRCAVEGWLTLDSSKQLFEQAGMNLEDMKSAALKGNFKPVSLGLSATLTLKNDIKQSLSNNVIATLPGSERPDEYVFYMAHWDHLGLDPTMEGDNIYNGAFDNATGVAGLLELAEAFQTLSKAPARSLVFLAVTAEEQGLLGSLHYAANPVYPRHKTVAAINMDGLNVYGKMKDITVIGLGNSELDDYLKDAAQMQNRVLRPDPDPEKGYFYRSDHFSFAKHGVPSLYTDNGIDHVEHGSEWTRDQMAAYVADKYHKPADEFDPDWDLTGAVDDLRLLFRVGYRLSQESSFPNWREGNEFKAIRDAEMDSQPMQSQK